MSKYPIKREFFPVSLFTPPVKSVEQAAAMGKYLKPPKWLWKCKEAAVRSETIAGHRNEPIEVLVIEPRTVGAAAPCLLDCHGGGYVFPAAGYHYRLAVKYACEAECRVVFPQYRLIPDHPFPTPVEDCYAALLWVLDNAEVLGVDKSRIAVGGDSAGGCLAAAVAQMARDRLGITLAGQMLVYPVVGCDQNTQSNLRFTDTPMWNSTLSKMVGPAYLADPNSPDAVYAEPVKAKNFENLPPAYIETAEFDCLHDDGIIYAQKLREADIDLELNETEGTMHGFDIVQKAPTTKAAVARRIAFLRKVFEK